MQAGTLGLDASVRSLTAVPLAASRASVVEPDPDVAGVRERLAGRYAAFDSESLRLG